MINKKELVYWTGQFRENITKWLGHNHSLFIQEWDYSIEQERKYLWKSGFNPYDYGSITGIIDRKGENKSIFNTNSLIKWVPFQEYPKTNFADCMFESAKNIADKGKTIDLFWSGGLDSTATLLAFNELGLEKQLHVIMGGELESPELFEKLVKGRIDYTWTHLGSNFYSISQPDKHILCTACECDPLFGAKGTLSSRGNLPEDLFECWDTKRRYYSSMNTWRMVNNFNGEYLDNDNYMPFYTNESIEKWVCNHVISEDMVYYDLTHEGWGHSRSWHKNNGQLPNAPSQKYYLKCKMPIRDFIYDITKDKSLSYQMGKSVSTFKILNEKPPNVLAITSEGTIINQNNFNDYDWTPYIANL
tara:strand:- start:46 stop:1125 length:1080 start_codon:yes stop_codon:yes gene_type:complete